jgi:hypothetical protein
MPEHNHKMSLDEILIALDASYPVTIRNLDHSLVAMLVTRSLESRT